ncbi:MAG: dienelactone hydrolase family protein [Pirellulaceae bacterium]
MYSRLPFFVALCIAAVVRPASADEQPVVAYPGTERLTIEGDIASRMVDGVDRFLLRELERSIARRGSFWNRDLTSGDNYHASVEPNRQRLAHLLGVRDEREPFEGLELVATTNAPAIIGQSSGFEAIAVRWPALRNIHGEGILLVPKGRTPIADVIAIPDADQTPEMIAGLAEGVPASSQFARRLAERGCRVLVPVLIDRELKPRKGRALLTNREYVHRSAYELGRHLIGYELQKLFAIVDWYEREAAGSDPRIAVFGWGEGGMLALYAAALDARIDATCVSGYFQSRQTIWQQPIDRNVFGLLEQFGDAELASLVAPRTLLIEPSSGPELELPSKGGAPAILVSPSAEEVAAEYQRAVELVEGLKANWDFRIVGNAANDRAFGSNAALQALLAAVGAEAQRSSSETPPKRMGGHPDVAARQQRQIHEIDDHNQWLLRESSYVRADFMKKLDTSSLEKYKESVEWYRDFYRREVIGHFDHPLLPPNTRSRKTYDEEKWTGYEIMLDVFPDVFAYGILCLPKDITPGQRRPVVVCQHGLEGRPQHVVEGHHSAYHDFAAKLAERGFITFAPQNIYIFKDRFRTLQRKAYPLKKTLFSIMVPQHQQILNWLKSLPMVDGERIGFYGLSYGGKSAMRIPPLVTDYCLSICSADFNEWVWKNASTRARHSYIWTGEYEIFEFDLGSTFNYAEMAALICPRPFMVERGHFDGVAPDEKVGHEYAKVRHLYNARLGIGDRTEIEWFYGPYKGVHTINGQGTFDFLHKHLKWEKR